VPALAGEWPGWDEESRLSFAMDWPLREDALARLEEWDRRGLLNEEQRGRLAALRTLVAQHRPILARLLEA
jgi:hypothetical protein